MRKGSLRLLFTTIPLLPSQRASPPGSSGVDGLLLDDLSREVAVVVRVLSVVEDDVVDEEEGDDGREDGDNRSSGEVKRSGRQSLHESRGAKWNLPDAEVLHDVAVSLDGSLSNGRVSGVPAKADQRLGKGQKQLQSGEGTQGEGRTRRWCRSNRKAGR